MAKEQVAGPQGYDFAKVLGDELAAIKARRTQAGRRIRDDPAGSVQPRSTQLELPPSWKPDESTPADVTFENVLDAAWELALEEHESSVLEFFKDASDAIQLKAYAPPALKTKDYYFRPWQAMFREAFNCTKRVIRKGDSEEEAEKYLQTTWRHHVSTEPPSPAAGRASIIWSKNIAEALQSKRLYWRDFGSRHPELADQPLLGDEAHFKDGDAADASTVESCLNHHAVHESWACDSKNPAIFKRLYLQAFLKTLKRPAAEDLLARSPARAAWNQAFIRLWREATPRFPWWRLMWSMNPSLKPAAPTAEAPKGPPRNYADPAQWQDCLHRAWWTLLIQARAYQLQKSRASAWKMGLVSLAFSGGGIRSASVNLGLMQGLADAELVSEIDYLSTVSGGGYTGGWFAAWVQREGDLKNVEQQLKPNRVQQALARRNVIGPGTTVNDEPEPIFHVRSYCSYLSPRLGLLTADSWTLWFILLRNWVITQMTLLPACVLCLMVLRVMPYYCAPNRIGTARCQWTILAVAAVSVAIGLLVLSYQLAKLKHLSNAVRTLDGKDRFRVNRLHAFVIWPILGAAILLCCLVRNHQLLGTWGQHLSRWVFSDQGISLGFALIWGLVSWVARAIGWAVRRFESPPWLSKWTWDTPSWVRLWWWIWSKLCPFFAGAATGLLFSHLWKSQWLSGASEFDISVWGPPLLLLVCVAAATIEVVLQGRCLDEAGREWWASVCARVMMYVVGWIGLFGVSLFAGAATDWVRQSVVAPELRAFGGIGAVFAWIATSLAGVVTGQRSSAVQLARSPLRRYFLSLAPLVFFFGLAIALSLLVDSWIVRERCKSAAPWLFANFGITPACPFDWPVEPQYLEPSVFLRWDVLSFLFVGGLAIVYIAPNLFSLHAMYTNRLVRCFLGASRDKASWSNPAHGLSGAPTGANGTTRQQNEITGFDFEDDLNLCQLETGKSGYLGPHLLINTTLNLVAGTELALQERKSDSFTLSSMYCGSRNTGFALLNSATGLTLGRAMAISGAAVSPSMGQQTSSTLTALLTVFNARLGVWIRNPRHYAADWTAKEPSFGGLILRELWGDTNEHGKWIYLSDGGHFENLGVYELIRRRCRYIIVCDAEEDPHYRLLGLATLIRNVRNDFGIRIDIDARPLQREPGCSHSTSHCVVGKIRYGDVDQPSLIRCPNAWDDPQSTGTLVYIKASLTGDEPTDVLSYAREHAAFPQEPTVNQFFKQSQFESYRALGYHLAETVVRDVCDQQDPRISIQLLFEKLAERWTPRLPGFDQAFIESSKALRQIHTALRTDHYLRNLSTEVYGKTAGWTPGPPASGKQAVAERLVIAEFLSVMEEAWLSLNLDDHIDHPANQGWKGLFTAWCKSSIFQRHWEDLQFERRPGFRTFCKARFGPK